MSARLAGLRYVLDSSPGIQRVGVPSAFRYVDAGGRLVRKAPDLERIRALVIPPAWKEVWICPSAHGHLQATGRDARGWKQYRYHPKWRSVRDETKYTRMIEFGKALPKIREQVGKDLGRPGLCLEKVLATIVTLLEISLIRVGNDEYARANKSYGPTTLRDNHVRINGATLHFHFRGKSGKYHEVEVTDPRIARIVQRCQDIPGQKLFQYLDHTGKRRTIESADVNAYLRKISGNEFTAKDFRTWAGTVLAARALQEFEQFANKTQAKKT